MRRILEWLPLIWTLRIGLLIVLAGGAYLYVLLIARFFRWKTIRAMVLADPPRVESVGGEFAGAKAELKLFQATQNEQRDTMGQRVTALEARVRAIARSMEQDEPRAGIGDE
jgi:hypothetical protein